MTRCVTVFPGLLLLFTGLVCSFIASAQQIGDENYNPPVEHPAYVLGKGPVVAIDEAHHNFHTAKGRYRAFADLLRRDGYVVRSNTARFDAKALANIKVLVIANALHERNVISKTLPVFSAFNEQEINAVEAWVRAGGALLLIADHMPYPGAAEHLAARFGFLLGNGYAIRTNGKLTTRFDVRSGSLSQHPIVRGRSPAEAVEFVTTFLGQAFRAQNSSQISPILTLHADTYLFLPMQAGKLSNQTPRIPAGGMLQGAVRQHGAGRVAMFGEAAMFTAQLSGPERRLLGMNHPDAPHNVQFVLNVLHWLSGLLP